MAHPRSNQELRRRQSRKRRWPSARNLTIHQAYRWGLLSQFEPAVHFGITQGRVSQIVTKVDRWLASHAARTRPDFDKHARLQRPLEELGTSTNNKTEQGSAQNPRLRFGLVSRSTGSREEVAVSPLSSAHEGPTNWHKWHTPLGVDLVATAPLEAAPQTAPPPQVAAWTA